MSKLATKVVIELNDCQEIDDVFRDQIRSKTFDEATKIVKEVLLEELFDQGATPENTKIKVYRFELID